MAKEITAQEAKAHPYCDYFMKDDLKTFMKTRSDLEDDVDTITVTVGYVEEPFTSNRQIGFSCVALPQNMMLGYFSCSLNNSDYYRNKISVLLNDIHIEYADLVFHFVEMTDDDATHVQEQIEQRSSGKAIVFKHMKRFTEYPHQILRIRQMIREESVKVCRHFTFNYIVYDGDYPYLECEDSKILAHEGKSRYGPAFVFLASIWLLLPVEGVVVDNK